MKRKESSAITVSFLMRFGLASIVLLATFGALAAQENSDKEPTPDWRNPDRSRTVDDLRKLNELVTNRNAGGGKGMGMGYDLMRDDQDAPIPRTQVLMEERKGYRKEIERLREELRDPKADRVWVEEQLASNLASYFITDLQYRVMELDEIKAQLAQTEAKLQKRLSAKVETVDLQLQIMLREAEGLGFFPEDDATNPLNSQPSDSGATVFER